MVRTTLQSDTLTEKILQRNSFTEAAELLLDEVVHYTSSQSAGFFVLPHGELIHVQGEAPPGTLALKIRDNSLVDRQTTSSKKGFCAAFPLKDEEVFGVIELFWKKEPPEKELDDVENVIVQNTAALNAVKRFEQEKKDIIKKMSFLAVFLNR